MKGGTSGGTNVGTINSNVEKWIGPGDKEEPDFDIEWDCGDMEVEDLMVVLQYAVRWMGKYNVLKLVSTKEETQHAVWTWCKNRCEYMDLRIEEVRERRFRYTHYIMTKNKGQFPTPSELEDLGEIQELVEALRDQFDDENLLINPPES